MRFLKQSARKNPKVSLILLDWSVRESFHLLDYLGRQSVDRDQFEIVVIEYYSRVAEPLKGLAEQVDAWVLLEMPEFCIYHKHLMYNCGLVFAHGEIAVFCDSDAMVNERFIETVTREFAVQEQIVLHFDQFRNVRRDLYPFSYPSFEEVLGEGCVNNVGGKTVGIVDRVDPLHTRNYGACMCARRADLIAIGGADEHVDYLGHICGPYEMTFRLLNQGFKEIWHETEYLYHTWHPGQAGVGNYQGPHDGRQMSTTALEALMTGRIFPLAQNRAIGLVAAGARPSETVIEEQLIDPRWLGLWDGSRAGARQASGFFDGVGSFTDLHRGFQVTGSRQCCRARTLLDAQCQKSSVAGPIFEAATVEALVRKIDENYPAILRVSERINAFYSQLSLAVWAVTVPIVGVAKALVIEPLGWRRRATERYVGSAGAASTGPLRGLRRVWDHYKVRYLAIKQYRAFMDRWMNNLVANLYWTDRQTFASRFSQLPVVLTSSLFVQVYLKTLSTFGILPRARITRLKNGARIVLYFDLIAREPHPPALIVARNIYTGYYGLIKACPNLKQLFVF